MIQMHQGYPRPMMMLISSLLGLVVMGKTQTLDSLLQEALAHNTNLLARQQEQQAVAQLPAQRRQLPDPRFTASWVSLPWRNRSWEQDAFLGVMQDLPWPGSLSAREGVALAEAQAGSAEVAVAASNLRYELRMAFYRWYEKERAQLIWGENLPLLRQMETLTTQQVATGRAQVADLLPLQERILATEQQLQLLRLDAAKALTVINRLCQRAPQTPLQYRDSLQWPAFPGSIDSLVQRSLEQHPQFLQFQYQQEVLRQEMKINQLEGRPDFQLGLDYVIMRRVTEHAGNLTDGKDMVMPRVGLRLPLYRQKYQARQQELASRRQALVHTTEAVAADFAADLVTAYYDHQTAQVNWRFAQAQSARLAASLQLRLVQLETGQITLVRYLDELTELQNYRWQSLQALVDGHRALAKVYAMLNL